MECTYLAGQWTIASQEIRTDARVLVDLLVQVRAFGLGAQALQVIATGGHFGQRNFVVEKTSRFITVALQESAKRGRGTKSFES